MNDPRVSDLMAAAGAKIGIKKHKVPPKCLSYYQPRVSDVVPSTTTIFADSHVVHGHAGGKGSDQADGAGWPL